MPISFQTRTFSLSCISNFINIYADILKGMYFLWLLHCRYDKPLNMTSGIRHIEFPRKHNYIIEENEKLLLYESDTFLKRNGRGNFHGHHYRPPLPPLLPQECPSICQDFSFFKKCKCPRPKCHS